MKILILNGSPRKNGNTRFALQQINKVLEQENEVSFLDLCSMKLSGCSACDGCKKNDGHCICPDDSDLVLQQIAQADAVIFGTPVYWWGMSEQMKMAVDKFYAQDAAFHKMKKKIGVVSVGANGLENPQYRLIREQFSCIAEYLGWNMAFSLSFSASAPGELETDKNVGAQLRQVCVQMTAES